MKSAWIEGLFHDGISRDSIVSTSDYDDIENQDTRDLIKKSVLSYLQIQGCCNLRLFSGNDDCRNRKSLKYCRGRQKAGYLEQTKVKSDIGRRISDE